MRIRRGIWIVATIAVVATAIVAWKTRLLWLPLPDPRAADQVGLARWIVLRDLAAEPPAVQEQLVNRVEELLDQRPEPVAVSAEAIAPLKLEQARRNVELLKELWFYQAVDRFHELDPRRRWAFLDRQIDRIARWMQWDTRLEPDGLPQRSDSWSGFFAAIERWAAKATRPRQERIWAAVKAGLIRWLGTTEVARQSEEARTTLALEIEKQLTEPLELGDATAGFSPREESRFWRNVERLAEAWFRHQARRHAAAPPREQARLVQRHLRLIEQFAPYFHRLPSEATQTPESTSPAPGGFMARVERWIEQSPPADQPAMRQLTQHLAGAMLLKSVESLWRKG